MGQPATKTELTFPRVCTLDEYFALSKSSVEKLEYYGGEARLHGSGEVVAMAGGTVPHGRIIGNVGGSLWGRLRDSTCQYYPPDVRVGVVGYPTCSYTDGHVICGPVLLDDRDPDGLTVLNPRLIVEVLSTSTEGNDRGRKFKRYIRAKSLQEYVLVNHDEPRVEVFSRHPGGGWLLMHYVGLDAVAKLRSIDVDLPLSEVYPNVAFPEPPEGEAVDSPAVPAGD